MIKIMSFIIFFQSFKKNVQLFQIYSSDSLKQQMSVKNAKNKTRKYKIKKKEKKNELKNQYNELY